MKCIIPRSEINQNSEIVPYLAPVANIVPRFEKDLSFKMAPSLPSMKGVSVRAYE